MVVGCVLAADVGIGGDLLGEIEWCCKCDRCPEIAGRTRIAELMLCDSVRVEEVLALLPLGREADVAWEDPVRHQPDREAVRVNRRDVVHQRTTYCGTVYRFRSCVFGARGSGAGFVT